MMSDLLAGGSSRRIDHHNLRMLLQQNRRGALFSRKTLAVGLLLNALFAISEYFLVPTNWPAVVFVRLVLVTPPVALQILLLGRRRMIRTFQYSMTMLMCWIGACATAIAYLSYPDMGDIAFISVAIALLYVLLLSRLRFAYGLVPLILTGFLTVLAALLQPGAIDKGLAIAVVFTLSIGGLCAYSAFETDRAFRQTFRAQRRLVSISARHQLSAARDTLTGLPNRRALISRMMNAGSFDGYMAMLDIDHFKQINDSYGHDAGDHVLRQVGELLRRELLGKDIAGRWGGEEFLLMVSTHSDAEIQAVAKRLLSAFRGMRIRWRGEEISITATIGIARCCGITPDQCRALADAALYEGKESGRNTSVIFTPTMLASAI